LFGSPNGYPNLYGTKRALGGLMTDVISFKREIETVEIPTLSIAAAIKPTA